MTRIIRAELLRLLRRRTLVVAGLAAVAFAVVATLAVVASATGPGDAAARRGVTLAELTQAGGGTQSFAVGASFVGFLVFVTFIAMVATELSGGTFRAVLLRDPHRVRVVVGKFLGAMVVAAGVLAMAEVASFGLSLLVAPGRDVDTSAWWSMAGLGHGARDYGTALAGVAGWAVFGTTLAVLLRSAPVALGVGFAWAGPFENIVVDSWATGLRVFPGQVLAALIQGGTPDVGFGRAALTASIYVGVAAAIGLAVVARRDVTA